uniref:SH3-domain GRB2-like 3b n=1 Tax=Amphiprion percula TaxID=161767 RepID=A0A3P8RVB2_AMPPE
MGAEGTKLDEDFLKMEKSVTVIHVLLAELLSKTTEFLQPNPAYRAKLSMLNTVSRIRGQGRATGYPQTEGMLGDCMLLYGQELGAASEFGGALAGVGEALQQVAQARDSLDVSVKRTFIDPMQDLHNSELKDIRYQLKKVNGRRLDFDYKRRRRGKVPTEELRQAWDKFITSKELAERSMFTLLQNDVSSNPRDSLQITDPTKSGLFHLKSSGSFTDSKLVLDQPCCRAMYSFLPNHEGELGFSEGDVIVLTGRADANWYEGTLGGRTGLFPVSYVDVLVPLPLP